MSANQLIHGEAAGLAYREAAPEGETHGTPVLFVHGFPESSYMWNEMLPVAAAAGRRAIAPDLPGFGDSPANPPTTWEHLVKGLESFVEALGLDRVILVVHDWGGIIGLRWACDNPERIAALVISDTGFFADAEWHDLAATLRTEGAGEEFFDSIDRKIFGEMMGALSPGLSTEALDHYWKSIGTPEGKRASLELYRSGNFEALIPYEGKLAALGVPALVIWGENDPFAPLAAANRFADEITDSRLHVIEGAGHFIFSDAPEECGREFGSFLAETQNL